MTNYIAYYRVSTDRQGRSGLGLDGQREAVERHLRAPGARVLTSFTEIESGRINARPELARALAECRRTGSTLLIAKLDRLSRRVSFLTTLMDGDVSFVACDNPNATRLTLHILAAVAEHEADMISARTKVALAAAKARKVKLGGFKGYVPSPEDRAKGKSRQREQAARRAASALPAIREAQAEGIASMTGIAQALNARGITTARGGRWQAIQVSRVLALAAA